jgi:subtilisin family serine protease
LAERIDRDASRSFLALSADALHDSVGHGTHIAGAIAGDGRAGPAGMRGVAPASTLVICRATADGRIDELRIAQAVEYAIECGVDIINFSAGAYGSHVGPAPWTWGSNALIDDAFEEAGRRGILCVVAAGNGGPAPGSISRPGGLESVLTVGAVDPHNTPLRVAEQSGRGPFRWRNGGGIGPKRYDPFIDRGVRELRKPDVVAPGVDVYSARSCEAPSIENTRFLDPYDDRSLYYRESGTSQATAAASGFAALALEQLRIRSVPLSPNPAAVLSAILRVSTAALKHEDANSAGHGLLLWPIMMATVEDFAASAAFRATVMNGGQLHKA